MALKLDEIINKKKEPNQILDLSKIKIKTKEEFEKYYDKIPEFKIRPEKLRAEEIRIRDTDLSFTRTKKDSRKEKKNEFVYGDPCPVSMRSVRLEDLSAVDISWRMLTMCRPKSKLEEDIFSRIVELGKLRVSTERYELKLSQSSTYIGSGIITYKNKKGTSETKMRTCKECGEELCTTKTCVLYPYDAYTRLIMDKDELEREEAAELGVKKVKNGKAEKTKEKKKTIKRFKKKRKKKVKKKESSPPKQVVN